jgi:hypothetical protein
VAERVTPPPLAEMELVVLAACGRVEMGNVAVVAPADTMTDAGTVAAVTRLLASVTT